MIRGIIGYNPFEVILVKLDPRLILVAVVTVSGNAYVQYLAYGDVNWASALAIGLVLTALLPLVMKKKK
ncbi:MAG: hypothetical protein JL50_13905 [Peptococcaceae bacterium BICA1-7]|nr:MAG: hypothetical protein JL50_13905 [Peptococcaceae bacterium BICA1-7]HBV96467.1 hypothetical protein [Desulfotomaculum sp.]